MGCFARQGLAHTCGGALGSPAGPLLPQQLGRSWDCPHAAVGIWDSEKGGKEGTNPLTYLTAQEICKASAQPGASCRLFWFLLLCSAAWHTYCLSQMRATECSNSSQ